MHKQVKEEEILWTRFREGDDRAFYRLYDLYVDNLYRYGSNFSRDKDLVKDCIQDLLRNGRDWVERKKPMVGMRALRNGWSLPMANSAMHATA